MSSKPSSSNPRPIKVFLRIRKPSSEEKENQKKSASNDNCFSNVSHSKLSLVNPRNETENLTYQFDYIFNQESTQNQVFEQVKSVLESSLNGENSTIFAYGQTGSGKTYTINGAKNAPGIIEHSIKYLINKKCHQDLQIQVSYIEIYNEKIYDLLGTEKYPSQGLDLREGSNKSIFIPGLTQESIASFEDYQNFHRDAMQNRTTAATKLNQYSSRSHFMMMIQITKSINSISRTSRLNIVDLAGSENNKMTGNSGARLTESGAINKSLFVLGQVVDALNKGLLRVPYRDSKITRLLQDSLGGKSNSLMIACVSPLSPYVSETYSTLNFASKSKLVTNKVTLNASVSIINTSNKYASLKATDTVMKSKTESDSSKNILVKRLFSKSLKPLKETLNYELVDRLEQLGSKLSQRVVRHEPSQDQTSILQKIQNETEQGILICLNKESLQYIMKNISGLGIKRATKIVECREEYGEFHSIKDLSRIGLSDGHYIKTKSH